MSVGGADIDQLCEFAIDFLLSGQGDARQLAVKLVTNQPDRPPMEVIFILASSAAAIEEVLSGPDSRALAVDTWRIAALVGVDLHMMEILHHPTSRCHDLLHYWQTEDPYFLRG